MRAVRSACNRPQGRIKLHEPEFRGREREFVSHCLDSGVVGYEWVEIFESMLAKECGVRHAVAMSSGTAALEIAIRCLISPSRGYVAIPSLTFHAVAAAVRHAGCLPRFVDTDFNMTEMDVQGAGKMLEAGAVVAVDLLGAREHGFLAEVCAERRLPLVEDAAEAMGQINGIRGKAAIVSFNNNKIITSNGGGALLTDYDHVANDAREMSTTARRKHPWLVEPSGLGWNYRMGNINAAIGCAQLERLEEMKASKRRLAERYEDVFDAVPGGNFIEYPWLNAIMVPPDDRDGILQALVEDGIDTRALFTPLHLTPPYKTDQDLPRCVETWRRVICLPSGPGLA